MRSTARSLPEDRPARETARTLVALLRDEDARLLGFSDIDLGPAVEQQLYFALRDGLVPSAPAAARDIALVLAATGGSALGRFGRPRRGAPAVLLREAIHAEAIAAVDAQLHALDLPGFTITTVGRAARPGAVPGVPLAALVRTADAGRLWSHALRLAVHLRSATAGWASVARDDAERMRRVARSAILRAATGAAALSGLAARGPSLLVAFDEKGSWARLIGPVGRAFGIPTLDLPHAEATDPETIDGADYDLMATYGPRSSAVLRAAGIPSQRIVEVGAPRFDALVARGPARPAACRVVLAGQYASGLMTEERLARIVDAALAAAAAVDGELEAIPHPAERRGQLGRLVAASSGAGSVRWWIGRRTLHDALDDAWLLVTGWSNSVLEAAIRSVPSIAVSPGGVAPVRYDRDGLALGATDAATAASVARSLREDTVRADAISRARVTLSDHVGPLDGRAAERIATVVAGMVAGR